ncbi:MAG: DUF4160 domain-containing protein [Flavobacteriaceae bacterium]|nr:DUF4160 domain-containing protein [Flavobacteriaceae bacterium]MDH5694959.1 DUF4160 domain-containing protein [Gammaproteobacteria bacterium]
MPTLKIIDSIKIDVYSREHPPPHFHAIYAEYEELIEIETLTTYAGSLPKKQRNKVVEWATGNQDYLMNNFERLNPGLCERN